MLPLGSLQAGSLYELSITDQNQHYLGLFEGYKTDIRSRHVIFIIYACQIEFFNIIGGYRAPFSIPRLTIIKHAMPSELPLYISWVWHSPLFMERMRAGV